MEQSNISLIDYSKISQVYKHLPHVKLGAAAGHSCGRCLYINEEANHFCTNCGCPMQQGETQLLYQFRIKQRKEILQHSRENIQVARIILYVIAALFLAGIGFLFGDLENRFFLTFLSIASASLFFLLARWSVSKPFTGLLTAFVIILTFSTIAVFGEVTHTFTSVQGVYTIVFCAVLLFFLLRGVQGAYKADLINEEMQVN